MAGNSKTQQWWTNTRHLKPILALVATVFLFTSSAHGDIGDQLFKLLPNDGGPDRFGISVAIRGSTAIVGASYDDDNGSFSGSAYVFDTTTGEQLFKLLANDGASEDYFGASVGISGNIAIVGARNDDDNGTDSGSAYLFDATTGQQLFKLLPNDGAAGAWFGYSVAIRGTIAVVGACYDGENGQRAGAVYLFDTTTGQQLFKLLANDGGVFDSFGWSVAIDEDIVLIGALRERAAYVFNASTGQQLFKLVPNDSPVFFFGSAVAISGTTALIAAIADNVNGEYSGSAYLFDVTTGQQLFKILPNDGDVWDLFGESVAINDAIAIVGAKYDDDNGEDSGSCYFFDIATGQQVKKIYSNDNSEGDNFGNSMACNATTAVIGASLDDDNGLYSGSAYLFNIGNALDTDNDGLLDSWETNGLDINNDGIIDLDLPGMGADPMRKDLFLEVDVMQNVTFLEDAQLRVRAAFANAPVGNPDNNNGITLHLDVNDGDTIPLAQVWDDDFVAFEAAKANYMGTTTERSSGNWANIKAARQRVFRYCAVVNEIDGAVGMGEFPGNDFYVGFGGVYAGDEHGQAATFMHELGHNLNLDHGGALDVNYMPNYVSVMNYGFDSYRKSNGDKLEVDFSREAIAALDESNLDETVGIQSTEYADVQVIHGFRLPGEQPRIGWVQLNVQSYDWNHDGDLQQNVIADLNWLGPGYPDGETATPGQSLLGQNDWDLIEIPLGTDGPFAEGQYVRPPFTGLTEEDVIFMRENTPPPPVNAAQFSGIQMVTGTLLDGDSSDLVAIDQSYVHTLSDMGEMELIVAAVVDTSSPAEYAEQLERWPGIVDEFRSPMKLSVLVDSKIDQATGVAVLSLRNWETGEFDYIGQYAISDVPSSTWFNEIDASDYVDAAGEVELSIKHTASTFKGSMFESFIDHVQIAYTK